MTTIRKLIIEPDDPATTPQAPKPASTGEHSPLPWSHYNSDNGRIFKTWSVQDSSGNKVCSLPETSTEANAEFIVRACNGYDELRAKYAKLWEERHDAKANAQSQIRRGERLADALRWIIGEALAQWEGSK